MTEPHDVSSPSATDLGVDADAERVRDLLTERAGAVRPHAAPVGQVVRRARRVRHRRTSVAVGAGLAAAAAIGAVVVVDRTATDVADLDVGLADATTSSAAPATTSADEDRRFVAVPGEVAPAAVGEPLRMGLDLPGAEVTSVTDTPEADVDAELPSGVMVDFRDGSGTRRMTVSALFDVPDPSPTGSPLPPIPTTAVVDLGGVQGSIMRLPVPQVAGLPVEGVQLSMRIGDDDINVIAVGLTDDEVLAVGRGITVGDGPALVLADVPADLVADPPRNPWASPGGGGVRSQVVYRLADGSDAVVDVVSRPGDFAAEIDSVRAAPTGEVFLREVRGVDAVVRRIDMDASGEIVTVTWIEPSGNLVTIRLEPAPGATVDPSTVDSVVELDEATFQDLLATHPAS